jgi:hypothetical protein
MADGGFDVSPLRTSQGVADDLGIWRPLVEVLPRRAVDAIIAPIFGSVKTCQNLPLSNPLFTL